MTSILLAAPGVVLALYAFYQIARSGRTGLKEAP